MTRSEITVYINENMRALLSFVLLLSLPQAEQQTRNDRLQAASRAYDTHDYSRVLSAVAPILKENPDHKRAVQLAGLSHYFLRQLPEAIPYLEKSVQWFPDNVNYQNILGLCYIQTSAIEKARGLFSRMFAVDPNSAHAHLINAQMFLRQGMWAAAKQEASRSLEMDGRIPQAHLVLAEVAMGTSNPEEAVKEFRAEIGLNPGLWLAHHRLGEALDMAQKPDEAAVALQRAIWINPNFVGPYVLLGKIMKSRGSFALAAQMLEQAVKLDPGNSNAHYMLGQAYQSLGRTEEADREFRKAQELLKAK